MPPKWRCPLNRGDAPLYQNPLFHCFLVKISSIVVKTSTVSNFNKEQISIRKQNKEMNAGSCSQMLSS